MYLLVQSLNMAFRAWIHLMTRWKYMFTDSRQYDCTPGQNGLLYMVRRKSIEEDHSLIHRASNPRHNSQGQLSNTSVAACIVNFTSKEILA